MRESGVSHPEAMRSVLADLAATLLAVLPPRTLAPGETLMRQGEASDAAWFLDTGSLSVRTETLYGPVTVAALDAPCLIGEIGAFTGLARTASVEATTAARVYRIDRAQLLALGREKPELLLSVIEQLGQNIRSVNEGLALYANALAALEQRDFDAAILNELANPPPQLAPFAAAFRRFAEEIFIKRRNQDELANAALIQKSFLPADANMDIDGGRVRVRSRMRPAREVGGDFYDYFRLDAHRLALVVGDVCGKGMPASLFMSATMTTLRIAARETMDPARILSRANALLGRDNAASMFATVFYGVLDLRDGVLDYCNCGHNPPVVIGPDSVCRRLVGGGLPLAVCEDAPVTGRRATLAPGDFLLMFTDGVSEALDATDVEFGEARILDSLTRRRATSPDDLLQGLFADVDAFVGAAAQADDMTCVALAWRGSAHA